MLSREFRGGPTYPGLIPVRRLGRRKPAELSSSPSSGRFTARFHPRDRSTGSHPAVPQLRAASIPHASEHHCQSSARFTSLARRRSAPSTAHLQKCSLLNGETLESRCRGGRARCVRPWVPTLRVLHGQPLHEPRRSPSAQPQYQWKWLASGYKHNPHGLSPRSSATPFEGRIVVAFLVQISCPPATRSSRERHPEQRCRGLRAMALLYPRRVNCQWLLTPFIPLGGLSPPFDTPPQRSSLGISRREMRQSRVHRPQ